MPVLNRLGALLTRHLNRFVMLHMKYQHSENISLLYSVVFVTCAYEVSVNNCILRQSESTPETSTTVTVVNQYAVELVYPRV